MHQFVKNSSLLLRTIFINMMANSADLACIIKLPNRKYGGGVNGVLYEMLNTCEHISMF